MLLEAMCTLWLALRTSELTGFRRRSMQSNAISPKRLALTGTEFWRPQERRIIKAFP